MKIQRQILARGWAQAMAALLALMLAVGLILFAPAPVGPAYGAPDDEPSGGAAVFEGESAGSGAITLHFPKDTNNQSTVELDPEETQFDLYKVAAAVRLSGYDVYAYCVDDSMPCYALIAEYLRGEQGAGWHHEELTAAPAGYPAAPQAGKWLLFYYAPATNDPVDGWQNFVERLAEFYLTAPADGEEDLRPAAPDASEPIGETAEGLAQGLYFAVVHGKDMKPEDYIAVEHPMTATGYRLEEGRLCTLAYSAGKVYYFQPQLIALPGRVDAAGEATTDTTKPGEWAFRVNAFTKGEALPRYADLELVKALENPGTEPATFIFHVAAYAPEDTARAKPIYEKMVSIVYDGSGAPEPVLLTNVIPAGSTVVITEEYSGAGYQFAEAKVGIQWNDPQNSSAPPELAVESTGNPVILTNIPGGRVRMETPTEAEHILPDGSVETVTFTNRHDNTRNGGSVVNQFTLDDENHWTWTQRRFDRETGEWIVGDTRPVTPQTP